MVPKATEFETMKVLYTLWKSNHMDVASIKQILLSEYSLELTILSNSEITAQSPDGKTKYSINK